MFSGGAEESTEKTSQSFQGQKVRLHYVYMKMCGCYTILYVSNTCQCPPLVL